MTTIDLLERVRHFWNNNALFTGESRFVEGSREYFVEHEKVVIEDCFAAHIDDLYFDNLQGKKVLDVGCGPGFWVRQFCSRGIETYAVDLTPKAVELTKKSLSYWGYKASVEVGNAECLPFPEHTFDHVNCQGVIHHTPDPEKCLAEFFRVLKPSGTICFSVYFKTFPLRHKSLYRSLRSMSRMITIGLKGRGRESIIASSTSPDDLVRMYDGRTNPLGKAYTRSEILRMASPYFEIEKVHRHFFPLRALPFKVPRILHGFLHRHFGLLIVLRGRKLNEESGFQDAR